MLKLLQRRDRDARRGAVMAGASVAIHAVLLGPLLLADRPAGPPTPSTDVWIVPVDIAPRPRVRTSTVESVEGPSPANDAGRPGVSATTAGTVADDDKGPAIQDAWRYRPDAVVGPHFRIPGAAAAPCVDPARLSEAERVTCAEIQATRDAVQARIAAMDPAAVGPRPGPSRQDRREDGFERQAQANENWRDYTRGDGAYPGLRSLLKER